MFERRDFLKGIAGLSILTKSGKPEKLDEKISESGGPLTLEKGKLYCLQIDFNSNLEVIADCLQIA